VKNKKSIYILLPLVIIIWGAVFWKLLKGGQGKILPPPAVNITNTVKEAENKEHTTLLLNYEDPFLKTLKGTRQESNANEVKQVVAVNRVVMWPMFEYNGMIRNNTSNKAVGMLKLNGKNYLVQNGDWIEGLFVEAVFPDSIILVNQTDKQSFKRKGIR